LHILLQYQKLLHFPEFLQYLQYLHKLHHLYYQYLQHLELLKFLQYPLHYLQFLLVHKAALHLQSPLKHEYQSGRLHGPPTLL
jgi:hypothetical protein